MLVVSEIEIEDRTLRSRVARIYDEFQLFSVINSKYVSRKTVLEYREMFAQEE